MESTWKSSQPTVDLLLGISTRLSSRADCRGVNYVVTIDHTGVSMYPEVTVFPNRYKKGQGIDVVSYVHTYNMPNALLSDFIFGTYQYQSSFNSKKRRWTRL